MLQHAQGLRIATDMVVATTGRARCVWLRIFFSIGACILLVLRVATGAAYMHHQEWEFLVELDVLLFPQAVACGYLD